jgi:hypothetical protein
MLATLIQERTVSNWKDRIMALAQTLRAKSNSVPFCEQITCTMTGGSQLTGLGRRKLNVPIAERRIKSLKIDGRRLIVVLSLLKLLNAGGDALVELNTRVGAR